MENAKIDLLSLDIEELCELLRELGEPKYRAKQVFTWLHKGASFEEMTNLPKQTRDKLGEISQINSPKIEKKLVSKLDGTVKYLFRLSDGNHIESVVMRYKHGLSICVSSQCGCRMGCVFCASGIGGKVRDLAPSEILGQIIESQKDLRERISNIVMMGIGEPMDNYDNVLKFLRLVNHEDGLNIGYRHISVSTCGVVSGIERLAKEGMPLTLSISLHAADDDARSAIMPINKRWNIESLLKACNAYFADTGRRVSFEYTLIHGKNDSVRDAEKLAAVLKKYLGDVIHVNLILLNTVDEKEFKATKKNALNAFCRTLEANKINATVRRTLGQDINASCGQLRRSFEAEVK